MKVIVTLTIYVIGVMTFLGWVLFTDFCFHFRVRLAANLGEAVVHDLRRDLYAHLLRSPCAVAHTPHRHGRCMDTVKMPAARVKEPSTPRSNPDPRAYVGVRSPHFRRLRQRAQEC